MDNQIVNSLEELDDDLRELARKYAKVNNTYCIDAKFWRIIIWIGDDLSEDFMHKYADKINLYAAVKKHASSEDFVENHFNKIRKDFWEGSDSRRQYVVSLINKGIVEDEIIWLDIMNSWAQREGLDFSRDFMTKEFIEKRLSKNIIDYLHIKPRKVSNNICFITKKKNQPKKKNNKGKRYLGDVNKFK